MELWLLYTTAFKVFYVQMLKTAQLYYEASVNELSLCKVLIILYILYVYNVVTYLYIVYLLIVQRVP